MKQEELSTIAKMTGDETSDSEDVKKRVLKAEVFKKALFCSSVSSLEHEKDALCQDTTNIGSSQYSH